MPNNTIPNVPRDFDLYTALSNRLEYSDDGRLTWKKTARSDLIGTEAGRVDDLGYRHIEAPCGRMVAAHKIIYFMHTSEIPSVVDHKDGNNRNNIFSNLRAATVSKNAMNCKMFKNNTSGVKGVSLHKQTGKWVAHIRDNGTQKSLGLFTHIFEAACARRSAELRYYGAFAR